MEPLLVKIFATALALSQVMTRPDAVKPAFDPVQDKAEVVQVLRDGCTHMRKAFDLENVNVDELIATAMNDPKAMVGEIKAFRGMQFEDLHTAYRQYCGGEAVTDKPVDLGAVIAYYNRAAEGLPDVATLRTAKLPGATFILDTKGENFAELFEPNHRRQSIPLSDVPVQVQQAFISAEDKRFREHRGIDERGVIRAFMGLIGSSGRPQGGSTITQQVAKNILVGDDVTYERKIREILVASRIEGTLSKDRILEIYLNSIYFGRGAWGIEMAARGYFGKPAKELTLAEGALLAALTKGPGYYNPDRHPQRAKARVAYVIERMRADDALSAEAAQKVLDAPAQTVAYVRPRREIGHHFVDQIEREARALPNIGNLNSESYTIRSTVNAELQRAVEAALQEGLARYEMGRGRAEFQGPEMNLEEAVRRVEKRAAPSDPPAWQQALVAANLPLYDVQWTPAIVVEQTQPKKGAPAIRVGLRDGQVLPLSAWSPRALRALSLHDVVYVRTVEARTNSKGKVLSGPRAELRTRPSVQGAAIVLENATGRVLAMSGGFSYPLSQLNRAVQSARQPGSALKPLVYLAALNSGLQPNTLIRDEPITFPPIGGETRYSQPKDYWSPKNYDGSDYGTLTLRRALENSRNLPTARLLDGGISGTPEDSLDRVCELAVEAQLYPNCMRYYPFVLGAQPVRLIDLAAFYATIANEGARPTPHVIDAIEQGGTTLYRRAGSETVQLGKADQVAFFQLKTMLQGVLARGTARSIARYSAFVGGKTGTSDEENDAWFVGFTNEVTVAVWVGYDNAEGRRTLGAGAAGGNVAVPIFDQIVQAAWAHHAPRTALRPPSAEARRRLTAVGIDLESGEDTGGRGGFVEYLRRDAGGHVPDTQYALLSRDGYYDGHPDFRGLANREEAEEYWRDRGQSMARPRYYWDNGLRIQFPPQTRYYEPQPRFYVVPRVQGGDQPRRPGRIDPDYFWYRR